MTEVEILDFSNLLVIGVDSVSLAASAKRAGYEVFAVDHFGDQDLKRVCRESLSAIKQRPGRGCGYMSRVFSPEFLLQLAKALLKRFEINAALLSSGLDDSSDILSELNELVPILGNHPSIIGKTRDKTQFFRELDRIGVSHPETAVVEDLEEARKESKDIGYPIVVKPSRGFGGAGVRKAEAFRQLKRAFREASFLDEKVLIQKYISGIHASASLISSIKGVVTLTVNEQLIGMQELGQREPFGYCGNMVPLSVSRSVVDECKSVVGWIAQHFGLVGSNGVDLVISRQGVPYVIEVNPRFQGTLECVERVLRMNIVEAHVEACVQGSLPTISKRTPVFCARFILFAPRRLIAPELNTFEGARDIPLPGVIVEEGEPLCSLIVEGPNRGYILQKASETAEAIRDSCNYRIGQLVRYWKSAL
ncbi:MAG: ATP-grasp domain-containing protein [Candidatus Bathyarchaeota archaeon]|nr:ATP-grasp domain-containing protein [Candidatus Bathyarchaeota archaeon]